jgi:hypothetical protein
MFKRDLKFSWPEFYKPIRDINERQASKPDFAMSQVKEIAFEFQHEVTYVRELPERSNPEEALV